MRERKVRAAWSAVPGQCRSTSALNRDNVAEVDHTDLVAIFGTDHDPVVKDQVPFADTLSRHVPGFHFTSLECRRVVGQFNPFIIAGNFVIVEMEKIPRHTSKTRKGPSRFPPLSVMSAFHPKPDTRQPVE
jgi:hypothetical protein